mgnify:CR=1 FL=1
MRTPENILMHELIGLRCEVVASLNKSQTGISGSIIDETMKSIVIESADGRKTVPKNGTLFRVSSGSWKADIDGSAIVARSEDRIKKKVSRW